MSNAATIYVYFSVLGLMGTSSLKYFYEGLCGLESHLLLKIGKSYEKLRHPPLGCLMFVCGVCADVCCEVCRLLVWSLWVPWCGSQQLLLVCGAVTWTDVANMKSGVILGTLNCISSALVSVCRQVSAVTPDGAWANPCNCLQGLYR